MKKHLFIIILNILIASIGYKANGQASCTCDCLKPLFDYLITSNRLFTSKSDSVLLSKLISDANAAGFTVTPGGCAILTNNTNKYFYALTSATTGTLYKAQLGDCIVVLKSTNSNVTFNTLKSNDCSNAGIVRYGTGGKKVQKKYYVNRSANINYILTRTDINVSGSTNSYQMETGVPYMRTVFSSSSGASGRFKIVTVFSIDEMVNVPNNAVILSADLHLFAYHGGFNTTTYKNAHSVLSETKYQPIAQLYIKGTTWNYQTNPRNLVELTFQNPMVGDGGPVSAESPFQDLTINFKNHLASNKRILDYGFAMINDLQLPASRDAYVYATFCSPTYPDVNKRPYMDITWADPADTVTLAQLYIDSCATCNWVPSGICYSAITDTSVNTDLYGITGNWRPYRSFAYYNHRSETDFTNKVNVRNDGTIKNYFNFWQIVNGKWQAQDTAVSRWVWNSESTLFNEKGAELETKDPLGRYTSGLYGYQNALATAIAQNARYREVAYEGFEDYNFAGGGCISCAPARNIDFTSYKANFDATEQHTGNYSLRIDNNKSAGITAVVTADNTAFNINIDAGNNDCNTGTALKGVHADKDALLPTFSPLAGKQMLVSAWVKESGKCDGTTYTGNQISVVIGRQNDQDIAVIAKPTGNIIEGWQQIEVVVDVPANATRFTVNMQNIGNNIVYFDDLRVHPYNANMKSYVYDEVSLRLMAELDENNYATFYEYDDDGSLVRLKKETERGIMTIKESRNGLLIK